MELEDLLKASGTLSTAASVLPSSLGLKGIETETILGLILNSRDRSINGGFYFPPDPTVTAK